MGIVVEVILKKEVIMPGGDKTGPEGSGPMTGRKLGLCKGNDSAGFSVARRGVAFGQGRSLGHRNGRGRGMRNGNRGRFNRDES